MNNDNKNNGYTCISNTIIRDNNLTPEARFILIYMISCPLNWVFNVKTLCINTNSKRTKIENCLKELQNAKYIERKIVRENGKIKYYTFKINEISKIKNSNDDLFGI